MKSIYTGIILVLLTFSNVLGQSVTNLKSMVGDKNMKVMYTNMDVNFCSECKHFGKITYKLHEESKESFICFDSIREDIYELFDGEIVSIQGKFHGLICDDGLMYYMFEAQSYSPEQTVSRTIIREKLAEVDPLFPYSEEGWEGIGPNVTVKEAKEALDFHNTIRAEVGVPPLSWSNDLALHAQEWADYLATTNNCELKHRSRKGEWQTSFGENLALNFGDETENQALKASELWYSEIKDFKNVVLNENNWSNTGHYSQMVWRKTKQVGLGVATCENGSKIIVASYNPAGNKLGEKAY
jgi:hypothetical protein